MKGYPYARDLGDPRVSVWASLFCLEGSATRVTTLAAYAVGQTLEYFTAGFAGG